jgi:hypothetical protein
VEHAEVADQIGPVQVAAGFAGTEENPQGHPASAKAKGEKRRESPSLFPLFLVLKQGRFWFGEW